MDTNKITLEEKELLRRLMETPGIEKEWDFFDGLSTDAPIPEYFMRGKPEVYWVKPALFGLAVGLVTAAIFIKCMY